MSAANVPPDGGPIPPSEPSDSDHQLSPPTDQGRRVAALVVTFALLAVLTIAAAVADDARTPLYFGLGLAAAGTFVVAVLKAGWGP